MLIIPAIDLKDGKCVRLKQGRMEDDTVFSDDPVATATHWVNEGARRLHLVDLNGAFAGTPIHKGVVEAIAKAHPDLPIQIGGGIRSFETIEHYLEAGVSFVIIGTKAAKEPEFVEEAVRNLLDISLSALMPKKAMWQPMAGQMYLTLKQLIWQNALPMQVYRALCIPTSPAMA